MPDPSRAAVSAVLDVRPALWNRAGSLVCVRPGYIPQLELDDGRKFDRCIAPGAAAAGFLIPPAVETTEGLWRWLATGEAPRVRLREES